MKNYNFADNYENINSWEFKKDVDLKLTQKDIISIPSLLSTGAM